MNNFKEKIQKEVIPAMQEKFGYKNRLAVPKIEKVTLCPIYFNIFYILFRLNIFLIPPPFSDLRTVSKCC